ncbi:MAG: UPF0058 family protein [Candidatus Hydrothermarchaeales archaeon]
MYKDELIHLHQLLVYLMKFFVDNGVPNSFFEGYTELSISPHHIHRTKGEHKYAVFMLAWSISKVLAENNEIVPMNVANRLGKLAERCRTDLT